MSKACSLKLSSPSISPLASTLATGRLSESFGQIRPEADRQRADGKDSTVSTNRPRHVDLQQPARKLSTSNREDPKVRASYGKGDPNNRDDGAPKLMEHFLTTIAPRRKAPAPVA